MSTCRTCEVAPLDCGTAITSYSLQEDVYFYETHCPPGSVCNALDEMLMECCDGVVLRVVFPDDATAELRDAIMQALLAEYWKRQALCATEGTADTTDGDPTDPDDPLQLYFNKYTQCTSYCSDGLPFTYIVLPGKFVGATQEDADNAAKSWACSQAKTHKICLSALKNSVGEVVTTGEVGTAFAAKIVATGAYLSDISNTWLLVSGSLPPGITFPGDVGSKSLPFVGTPTAGGVYNFTMGIRAPNGDYQTKAYTLTIAEDTGPIACFSCNEGSPVTRLLNAIADHHLEQSLGTDGVSVAGKLGNALRADTVERIFTAATDAYWDVGTSFTVRFWIRTSSTNSIFNILTLWNDDGAFEIQGVFFGGQFKVNMECETVAGTESVSSAAIPLSQWNHVVCWFENGVGLGIKINNGSATTFATTSPLTLTAAHNLSLRLLHNLAAEPVDYEALDEIAIWKRKLSDAEMTSDWNGGDGTTCGFLAYWKCEENAVPLVDSLGNADFETLDAGAVNRVAGKLGYGLGLDSVELHTGDTDRFAFGGDFTIRFWFYDAHTLTSGNLMNNDPDSGDYSFELELNNGPGDNGILFRIWDATNTGHDLQLTAGNELSLGWHRVMIWYEAGVGMGGRIDNGADVTLAQAAGIYATPGTKLCLNSNLNLPGYRIDEIAVWDRLLTTAENLADWNGGTGTTYPTI